MTLRNYPTRLLVWASLSSLLILALCGVLAANLIREQSRAADTLGEDIVSKRAAADLEESLTNLADLLQQGATRVEALHARIELHLRDITRLANKDEEAELARAVAGSYQGYRALGDGRAAAVRKLREETLPACHRLRDYNLGAIEQSASDHRLSLQWMAWGLAVVGGLGSVGGLVLGFGLARGLRQTIHQFLVRVQGASDLLGQELPAIEFQPAGGPTRDGTEELVHRVEQVILKLQQRDREVRRAEQLAALGQLAAGVAHEIRNPLTSAILLIQTARRDPGAGGMTDEDLELIEGELGRIETTLQTFLDYARPPTLQRSVCDLGGVVRDALNLVRARVEQQQVAVTVELPPGGLLECDRHQLRQVVLNLILNALDVMPAGGALTIVAGRTADGRGLELAVCDTGPGIAAEVLPHLFQPFTTGKETGLGLGLVVSRRIVEAHGGTLTGRNRREGGACFVVRLPCGAAADRGVAV